MRAGLIVLGTGLIAWAVLVIVLWTRSRDRAALTMAARLLPDTIRLVGRVARDRTIPRPVRWPLWLVLAYLGRPVVVSSSVGRPMRRWPRKPRVVSSIH